MAQKIGQIQDVALYKAIAQAVTPEEAAMLQAAANIAIDPGTLLVGLGTFGTWTVARMVALQMLGKGATLPAVMTIDNGASQFPPITLPDGTRFEYPYLPDLHLHLDSSKDGEDRRSQIGKHKALVNRYEGPNGLLRGHSVAATGPNGWGGNGGNSIPQLSLVDIDLLPREVRRHIRRALERAMQQREEVGLLDGLANQFEQQVGELTIVVIAGGSGSCGAALCQLISYMIRQEAADMGLPRPTIWLLLAGPRAFQGLTKRTERNWGATVESLRYLAQHGAQGREFIDGRTITEKAQAYDKTLLIDDPRLPGDGKKVSDLETELFSYRVAATARALLQPQIRNAYADHFANPDGDGEAETDWPGFGTVQLSIGGFQRSVLERQTEAQIIYQRAKELQRAMAV